MNILIQINNTLFNGWGMGFVIFILNYVVEIKS